MSCLTQGSNLGLPHCKWTTYWATREPTINAKVVAWLYVMKNILHRYILKFVIRWLYSLTLFIYETPLIIMQVIDLNLLYQTEYFTHGEWVKVAESWPVLCDPMDHTVPGILQARILEWVALPFSRGSSQPRDRTWVSHIAGRLLTSWATREVLKHGIRHKNII